MATPATIASMTRSDDDAARSVAVFFGLTFLLAWTLWLAAASIPADAAGVARGLLFLPGTFAPAMVALALTARRDDGGAALRALVDRLFLWRVPVRWYVFAAGYTIAIKLTAAAAHRVVEGAWPAFGDVPVVLMLAAVLVSTPFQAGEEIGWRGYALPRLARRAGLARASLLLGVVWAVWHLPLFLIADTTTTGQPFLPYLASVTGLSVALAFLWSRTRGSLLLVMLMHAAINNTKDIVPSAPVAPPALETGAFSLVAGATPMMWLTALVLWLVAAILLLRMRSVPASATLEPLTD